MLFRLREFLGKVSVQLGGGRPTYIVPGRLTGTFELLAGRLVGEVTDEIDIKVSPIHILATRRGKTILRAPARRVGTSNIYKFRHARRRRVRRRRTGFRDRSGGGAQRGPARPARSGWTAPRRWSWCVNISARRSKQSATSSSSRAAIRWSSPAPAGRAWRRSRHGPKMPTAS